MLKKSIKYGLQTAISWAGPQNLHNTFINYLVILTYHRILPISHPAWAIEQPGMCVSPETFEMHIKNLQSRFTIMHLNQWITAARQGNVPKRALAITFDDGWLDNYEFAYPILKHYQIPATVFVVTDLVGTNYSFWPNRLGRLLSGLDQNQFQQFSRTDIFCSLKEIDSTVSSLIRYPVDRDKIDRLVILSKVLPESRMLQLLEEAENIFKMNEINQEPDLMDWSHIKDISRDGLIEIGSHTCSHCRLVNGVEPLLMEKEIVHSRNTIIDQIDRPVSLFCYPNGDYNKLAIDLVKKYYSAACTTLKGWNTMTRNKYMLKRVGFHEDISSTKEAFLGRLSGYI